MGDRVARGGRHPIVVDVRFAPVVAFVLTVVAAAALTVFHGPPLPKIHDEWSYVLGGDTFASFRLANPPHPLWRSFETFHVLPVPTYASKYPPSQGLLLALGQVVFGHQWVGIWIGLGLAAAATTWFSATSKRARETWLTAVVAAFLLGNSYWAYSYFSAAPAAIGGALVAGGMLRWVDAPRRRLGAIVGFGAVVLMASRPFEGLLLCVAIAVVVRKRLWELRAHLLIELAVPLGAIFTAGGALLLFYDHAVTGKATMVPYMLYEELHGPMPIFVWGHPRTVPAAPTQPFVDFVTYNVKWYRWATGSTAPLAALFRLGTYTEVFLVFPLALALPVSLYDPDLERRKDSRRLAAVITMCFLAMLVSVFSFAHYAAPFTALFVVLLARGVLVLWDRSPRWTKAMPFVLAASLAVVTIDGHSWAAERSRGWHHERADVDRELRTQPGEHLVFVTYGSPHDFLAEWVYNRADLEHDRVLWARSLDEKSDRKLMAYYPQRRLWRIVVTDRGHDLEPLARP